MTALYRKYEPKSFEDVVGQEQAMQELMTIHETVGLGGQAYWITGASATGKSTIANLIANAVADPCTTFRKDALDVSLDVLRGVEAPVCTRATAGLPLLFHHQRVHNLSGRNRKRLLTLLEDGAVQDNSCWIFTTTDLGDQQLKMLDDIDVDPFLSRFIKIQLSDGCESRYARAKRVMKIATEVNLNGCTIQDYVELINACNGNMRDALQEVVIGKMKRGSKR